ncbi:hypothetical protein BPOR_0149g00070 [Botrytis porri]|uniref:Uncharacterized protein n=1 Tax=Botrytis porri TaxID=87229 RepID=A0A4Z1KW48_9HELO|nr:hypothetical protein BPOR_0149g00070 [Botrytis porri]
MDYGRRNSDNTKDHLKYHTLRGNSPTGYGNREGQRPNQYPLFESRELSQRRINANRTGPVPLYEYPVTTPDKSSLDYSRAKVEPRAVPPHERAMRLELETRLNDVGLMRGNTGPDKKIVGAIYHPVGDGAGFARAELQPLDRQGREHNRMLHERAQHVPRSSACQLKQLDKKLYTG